MGIELKISFDGTEPGLQEHRLSLSSFGKPLELLLGALRRTASAIIAQAGDDPTYGSRGGNLAADARLLDLELEKIEGGSTTPTFICVARTPPPSVAGQVPLPFQTVDHELAQTAVERLLHDIDAERSGRMCNSAARRFLESIPSGVTKQSYKAMRDGRVLVDVSFGNATLANIPTKLPRLIRISGDITSVGFEPGASFITLKTTRAGTMKCAATPQQVETAIALRGNPVIAAVLDGEKSTLVWIRGADQVVEPPSVEETTRYAHAEWGRTLEALAK